MACAKYCSDLMIRNGITAKHTRHQIWAANENSLVECVLWQHSDNVLKIQPDASISTDFEVPWDFEISHLTLWCLVSKNKSQIIYNQRICWENLMFNVMVKVQFRGLELYKKKGALFEEESYLPRIFRSSSLNLHTFHLINIVFWWRIFFRKHGKSTPTIGKTTMFWSPTLWSWRHNAGARELSANQMLQSMTTTCR